MRLFQIMPRKGRLFLIQRMDKKGVAGKNFIHSNSVYYHIADFWDEEELEIWMSTGPEYSWKYTHKTYYIEI